MQIAITEYSITHAREQILLSYIRWEQIELA